MKIPTTKIVILYCIFISFLTVYLIPTNITPANASIKFLFSSISYAEKCQQAGHLVNKITISGFVFPHISTDCQMDYALTVVGNDAYRGTDNLFIIIKQASAAGQTSNTGSDSESNSYPVYKIIILIIAFVGAPGAILTLRSILNKRDANSLQSNTKVEVEIRGGSSEEESGAGNSGVPKSYTIPMFDPKFRNALKDFFVEALKELVSHNLEHFQAVASWYGESTESPGEKRGKNSIVLNMTNEMAEQLLKHVEPYFVDSLISKIMTKTNFLDGRAENDFRTEPIPIEVNVEITKLVDVKAISSIKFWFKIETGAFIEELSIKTDLHNPGLKLIKIEKMHVELRFLFQKMEGTDISLDKNMILGEKKIEINDLSYGIRIIS
jgi:hypothetical protein